MQNTSASMAKRKPFASNSEPEEQASESVDHRADTHDQPGLCGRRSPFNGAGHYVADDHEAARLDGKSPYPHQTEVFRFYHLQGGEAFCPDFGM